MQQAEPDPEPEWRFPKEAIYAASYLFYGLAPPAAAGDWGRGRRPEGSSRGIWGYAVIFPVVGTYLVHALSLSSSSDDYSAAAAVMTAVALLPTCRPLSHGPPMCYDWERPAAMEPQDSGSGDSDWTNVDDEMTSMQCFYGLVRDATRNCGYEHESPAIVAPGDGSGDSNYWTGNNGKDKDTMECFYRLVHDAAKTCFGRSYI